VGRKVSVEVFKVEPVKRKTGHDSHTYPCMASIGLTIMDNGRLWAHARHRIFECLIPPILLSPAPRPARLLAP